MQTMRAQRERDHELEPHEVTTMGAALGWVIGSLGRELLPAADLLRVMMETRVKQHVAFDAIGRMGRDGLVFYDELISKLGAEGSYHKEARALGALLQSAPEKIAEILEIPIGTVSSRLVEGLARLTRLLQPKLARERIERKAPSNDPRELLVI